MRPVGLVRADTDGLYYLQGDTEWAMEPTGDDPGVIRPKPGATPRDSFDRSLDEPTIDDGELSQANPDSASSW